MMNYWATNQHRSANEINCFSFASCYRSCKYL